MIIIKKEKYESIIRELAPYLNLGWQLAITVALMVFLGWWLDKQFDTSPILIIIFSLFGVLAGMVSFFRTVLNLNKKNQGLKK